MTLNVSSRDFKIRKVVSRTFVSKKLTLLIISIIISLLFLACKKQESKVEILANKKAAVIESLEKDFLGQVGTFNLRKPYLISTRIFNTYNNLTEDRIGLVSAKSIFKNYKETTKFGLEVEILFSENFRTFVVYKYDENEQMHYKLVTYTNDYVYIDAIDVSFFDLITKMNETEAYVYDSKLFVHNKNTGKSVAYIVNSKGVFEKQKTPVQFNYLPLKVFKNVDEAIIHTGKRVVKAKKGLIIRDSIGNKIGKFNYLDAISVLKYDKDLITVKDNGKIIKGFKAKVIVNPNQLKKSQNFFISKSNTGYVFSGYLFEDDTAEENDVYKYFGITLDNEYLYPFSLKELLNMEPVHIKPYLHKVIKTTLITDVTKLYKTDKRVELVAENGKKVIYKDTTYANREYEPSKVFSVSEDVSFENKFVVNYQMLFDYRHFYFIDKQTGELVDTYFGGYPHVSPNKELVISVDYDAECPNQRTLFIDKIVNNKIVKKLQIHFDTSEQKGLQLVKTSDKNEVYWLNNKSFIVKFWGATDCYDSTEDYFYYKFILKDQLFTILESH